MGSHALTPAEAAELIVTKPAVGLAVACAGMDVSQATGSRLIARGAFPVPIIRLGARVIVPTAPLRALLHLDGEHAPEPPKDRRPSPESINPPRALIDSGDGG